MEKTIFDFLAMQKTVLDLFKEKNYEEVIKRLEHEKVIFPGKIDRIGHWLSSIYCLQNNKAKALSELNEVLSKGSYWNPSILTNDPDLTFIHNSKEFASIVKKSEELYHFHKLSSRSVLHTLGNKDAKAAITALHWKNSNAEDFSQQIAADTLKNKYLFSFIQSSQLFSNGCYHWDDDDIAKTDIEMRNNEFESKFGINFTNRVILGASQGADTALKMYFDANSSYDKVIALVPTFTDLHIIEEKIRNTQRENAEMIIITGDKDYFYHNVLDAIPVFEKYNIPCKLIVIEGMGHTIPDDFVRLIEENIE